ncbi:MAG: hypothetical protein QOD99_2540 [Chthoniobacter sp.]|nr:hypothetical protein [Chthoniobacter sp.]
MNSADKPKTPIPDSKPFRLSFEELETMFREAKKKWFGPIFEQFLELEADMCHSLLRETDPAEDGRSTDESIEWPQWAANCFYKSLLPFEGNFGLKEPEINSRAFGSIIGAKWVICRGLARVHPALMALKPAQITKIEKVWGEGSIGEVISFTAKFVTRFFPRMEKIKSAAGEAAKEQDLKDHIDFLQGLTKGMEFPLRVLRMRRPPDTEQDAHLQRRLVVYNTAFLLQKEIEERRGKWTWEELTERISQESKNYDLDSGTVKKTLSRVGLKRIGPPGPRSESANRDNE